MHQNCFSHLSRLFRSPITLRIAVVSLCFLGACSKGQDKKLKSPFHRPLRVEAATEFDVSEYSPIAVLPLADESGNGQSERLSSRLIESIQRNTRLVVLNAAEPQRVDSALGRLGPADLYNLRTATEFGRTVQARGVLSGKVTRYVEATGTALGGEQLASVGFQLWLLDVKTGKVVWSAYYSSEDQPLSENLFRAPELLNRGIAYRSADTLVNLGFDQAAQDLEKRIGQQG